MTSSVGLQALFSWCGSGKNWTVPDDDLDEEAGDFEAMGQCAMRDREPTRAIEIFSEAIKKGHDIYAIRAQRSACYNTIKDHNNALEDAMACINMDPVQGLGYLRKGQALCAQQDWDGAEAAYHEGLQVNPGMLSLINGVAEVQQMRQVQAYGGGDFIKTLFPRPFITMPIKKRMSGLYEKACNYISNSPSDHVIHGNGIFLQCRDDGESDGRTSSSGGDSSHDSDLIQEQELTIPVHPASRQLDLSENALGEVPDALKFVGGLQRLVLNGNELCDLPPWLHHLTFLTELSASRNRFGRVPDSVQNLTTLTSLNLSGNKISSMPQWISQLASLKAVSFEENRLSALPESMGRLSCLLELHLVDNIFSAIPECVMNMSNLLLLDMTGNDLEDGIPEWMDDNLLLQIILTVQSGSHGKSRKHPCLRDIARQVSAGFWAHIMLDQGIGERKHNFSGSFKERITVTSMHTQAPRLDFSCRSLETVPDAAGCLLSLRTLILDNNRISDLPGWISELQNLQVLSVKNNWLSSVPVCLSGLTDLAQLSLAKNGITVIPEWFSRLVGLRSLDLSDNAISDLPLSFRALNRLFRLNLAGNKLIVVPLCIGDMKGLQLLDLTGNTVQGLPDWLDDFEDDQLTEPCSALSWGATITCRNCKGTGLVDNLNEERLISLDLFESTRQEYGPWSCCPSCLGLATRLVPLGLVTLT